MDGANAKVLLRDEEYVETLWAERVGPDRYRLNNSPFWAYSVSWLDVVEAHPDENGQLAFARIVEKSGTGPSGSSSSPASTRIPRRRRWSTRWFGWGAAMKGCTRDTLPSTFRPAWTSCRWRAT